MPTGYHPAFRRGATTTDFARIVQFDSDGSIYRYTSVSDADWTAFVTALSHGGDFNALYRPTWLAFGELALWPDDLDAEFVG